MLIAPPYQPNGSHNAALAIEDAVTLGNLFSRLRHVNQIPLILSAYEEIRQPRCADTQESERRKRDFICMPHGPEQRARDAGLREAMEKALLDWDDADEEFLREAWGEYIERFALDANEMADDWWTKWGTFLDRGLSPHGSRLKVSISLDRGLLVRS